MGLFYYFGRKKVKAGDDNNNSEATKKDDDQDNSTGISKSMRRKKVQEKDFECFKSCGRPWLKFDKKENTLHCSYCSFQKMNLNLEAKKVTIVSVLMG